MLLIGSLRPRGACADTKVAAVDSEMLLSTLPGWLNSPFLMIPMPRAERRTFVETDEADRRVRQRVADTPGLTLVLLCRPEASRAT